MEKALEIRGIDRNYLTQYLLELNGIADDPTAPSLFTGSGWSCTLSAEDYFIFFQSKVPKVLVTFSAEDAEILDEIIRQFRVKTFRAGG